MLLNFVIVGILSGITMMLAGLMFSHMDIQAQGNDQLQAMYCASFVVGLVIALGLLIFGICKFG